MRRTGVRSRIIPAPAFPRRGWPRALAFVASTAAVRRPRGRRRTGLRRGELNQIPVVPGCRQCAPVRRRAVRSPRWRRRSRAVRTRRRRGTTREQRIRGIAAVARRSCICRAPVVQFRCVAHHRLSQRDMHVGEHDPGARQSAGGEVVRHAPASPSRGCPAGSQRQKRHRVGRLARRGPLCRSGQAARNSRSAASRLRRRGRTAQCQLRWL